MINFCRFLSPSPSPFSPPSTTFSCPFLSPHSPHPTNPPISSSPVPSQNLRQGREELISYSSEAWHIAMQVTTVGSGKCTYVDINSVYLTALHVTAIQITAYHCTALYTDHHCTSLYCTAQIYKDSVGSLPKFT